MRTIDDRLIETQLRPSGFDYLRIILAVSVIAWHGIVVCYGSAAEAPYWSSPLRPLIYLIVPAFFALSGFLVASSLYRNNLPSFLTLRSLRIFPALIVEVTISALILGPVLTQYTLSNYFSDPLFRSYFLNVIGYIHYYLPGLFLTNPYSGVVNAQLWTIPFELECYIIIAFMYIIKIHNKPFILIGVLFTIVLSITAYKIFNWHHIAFTPHVPGRVLVLCFLFGVALYAVKQKVIYSIWVFIPCLILTWVLFMFDGTLYLAPIPVAYVTVYLGLMNPKRLFILRGADYSYGIYLYGFPIQQTLSFLFPHYRIWAVNVIGSLLVTGVLAAFSWHFVESKVMDHRKRATLFVSKLCDEFLVRFRATFRGVGSRWRSLGWRSSDN